MFKDTNTFIHVYIQGGKFHLGKCLQTFVVNLDSGGRKVWLLVKYCYILSPLLPIKYLAIHYQESPFRGTILLGNDKNYFDFEMKKGISQSGLERESDHQP